MSLRTAEGAGRRGDLAHARGCRLLASLEALERPAVRNVARAAAARAEATR
jgi:hypothetical protein